MRVLLLEYCQRLAHPDTCRGQYYILNKVRGSGGATGFLELLNGSYHLAVQLSSGRVQEWALTWPMVVCEMNLVRTIAYGPLRSLLDGKKPKLAIAFARRRLSFPLLRTHSTRRLSSTVTHEQNLFQPWDCLLRPPNHNSIAHRRAIRQHMLVNCVEASEATPLRRR